MAILIINGEILLNVKYESLERALEYDDNNIYLIAMENGKKGVFKNHKKLIDLNFQDIIYSDLSNVFIVNKNGKYGFYNNSIGYTNRYVEGFISFLSADDTDFFNQIVEGYKSMKVSNCYYGNSGIKACQAVRGDSGDSESR